MISVLVVTSLLVTSTYGYPEGAPSSACGTMTPQHGFDPQSNAAPYGITLGDDKYSAGGSLTGMFVLLIHDIIHFRQN